LVGTFKAEEWNSEVNNYMLNANMGIKITVDVHPPNRGNWDVDYVCRKRLTMTTE